MRWLVPLSFLAFAALASCSPGVACDVGPDPCAAGSDKSCPSDGVYREDCAGKCCGG